MHDRKHVCLPFSVHSVLISYFHIIFPFLYLISANALSLYFFVTYIYELQLHISSCYFFLLLMYISLSSCKHISINSIKSIFAAVFTKKILPHFFCTGCQGTAVKHTVTVKTSDLTAATFQFAAYVRPLISQPTLSKASLSERSWFENF